MFCVITILTLTLNQWGGYIDYFYNKFTTPKASSLILGDSRSFQGLQPKVINEQLKDCNFKLPIFNYSFTIAQITYDSLYLSSIKRKLDTTKTNGLFVLSVHPYVLSERNGGTDFSDAPPHNMYFVDKNPNFEYLIRNLDYFHFRGVFRKSSKTHKDGWLEETNLPDNTRILAEWKENQENLYSKFSKEWMKSKDKLNSLEEIMCYLSQFGNVFLVRMPVDIEILNIENAYWPDFNACIEEISANNQIPYLDFSNVNNRYSTYDGVHIDKFSGVDFAIDLCDSISQYVDNEEIVNLIGCAR